MTEKIEDIEVDRIFLYEENPRHEPLGSQEEIIAHLCRDEQVLTLAGSIVVDGLNPLDLVGLVEKPNTGRRGTKKAYAVWEGNRRICAIHLLNDPERAPAKQRKQFERLAQNYRPIRHIKGVVFSDHDRLRFWMANIHGGEQNGVGRKRWNADSKARFAGTTTRHALALELLERAQDFGFITPEQRRNRLTTVDRYVKNAQMKEALGVDSSDLQAITTDLTDQDFKAVLKTLVDDLLAGTITSRHNSDKIRPYARKLPGRAGATTERVEPRLISRVGDEPNSAGKQRGKSKRPAKPRHRTRLTHSQDLHEELQACGNDKLSRLYYSICDVSAHDHPQLVAIGAWAFIESLTAFAGRQDSVSFADFYNKNWFTQNGFGNSRANKPIRTSIDRLASEGNTTKHHAVAAIYDANQLINDMDTVTPVLITTLKNRTAP